MNSVLEMEQKCIYTDDIILGLWYNSYNRNSQPIPQFVIVAPDITHKFNDQDTPKLGSQNLGDQGRNIICFTKFKKYSPRPSPISPQLWHRNILFWYIVALLLIIIVYIIDRMNKTR